VVIIVRHGDRAESAMSAPQHLALSVTDRDPPAGATLTLKLAGFGRFGPVLAARIGPKMTLKMTLSQGSLENLDGLALLGGADVAVDLHRRLARCVTQQHR
jgi:hypothetical protein